MKASRVVSLVMCFFFCASAYSAAPEEELKTVAVAAFKNGLAFVVKRGDLRLDAGTGTISRIPSATLGSLWITPNDAGATLDEAVAYTYKVKEPHNLTALSALLLANAGKVVTVEYGNQKDYTGEIVGLREEPPAAQPPGVNGSVPIAPPPSPEYLLLKTDGKLMALYLHSITQVTLPADPVLQSQQEVERKALRVRIKGAGNHANLTMGYLEHGLGWTPSYLVSLHDDKTAQLTMQAVLVDDAEDIKGADVFFVVGVPNFAYAHIPSPMALQQSLMEFMNEANRRDRDRLGGGIGGLYSNAITGQRSVDFEYDAGAAAANFSATVEELSGAPEEDLFLYTRSGVTLARGERATYNVFSGTVDYEDIYEWEVQDRPRVDGSGIVQNYNNSSTDQTPRNNIWHSLRLKNTTKFPWTSAPTMVISGTKPLSQDTLPYTPKGATSNLKLTIATDIRSSHEEQEVARQQNVERRRGYNYDLVTVEGTLKIKNYKSKDVKLSVTRTLRGAVESQTDGGKAEKLGEAISVDNPMSRLSWELSLKPGEERTITYRYKLWLRV